MKETLPKLSLKNQLAVTAVVIGTVGAMYGIDRALNGLSDYVEKDERLMRGFRKVDYYLNREGILQQRKSFKIYERELKAKQPKDVIPSINPDNSSENKGVSVDSEPGNGVKGTPVGVINEIKLNEARQTLEAFFQGEAERGSTAIVGESKPAADDADIIKSQVHELLMGAQKKRKEQEENANAPPIKPSIERQFSKGTTVDMLLDEDITVGELRSAANTAQEPIVKVNISPVAQVSSVTIDQLNDEDTTAGEIVERVETSEEIADADKEVQKVQGKGSSRWEKGKYGAVASVLLTFGVLGGAVVSDFIINRYSREPLSSTMVARIASVAGNSSQNAGRSLKDLISPPSVEAGSVVEPAIQITREYRRIPLVADRNGPQVSVASKWNMLESTIVNSDDRLRNAVLIGAGISDSQKVDLNDSNQRAAWDTVRNRMPDRVNFVENIAKMEFDSRNNSTRVAGNPDNVSQFSLGDPTRTCFVDMSFEELRERKCKYIPEVDIPTTETVASIVKYNDRLRQQARYAEHATR